jgi:hypothetical protein
VSDKPIEAWLVREPKGKRALFLDRAIAEGYAALRHGTAHPLVEAERASDLVQQPEMPAPPLKESDE